LFIHTGATSFGSFNQRFALPNELGSFTQTAFPIRYEVTTDPMTGKRDGLGARVPAGQEPKIFFVDSGSEYWDRGRVAALRHLSMDGLEDLADPPNVRIFTLAGAKHGPGSWPPADSAARSARGARSLDAKRSGAAPEPAPSALGPHAGCATRHQISEYARGAVALSRAWRLS